MIDSKELAKQEKKRKDVERMRQKLKDPEYRAKFMAQKAKRKRERVHELREARNQIQKKTFEAMRNGLEPDFSRQPTLVRKFMRQYERNKGRPLKPVKDKFQKELDRLEAKKPKNAGIGVLDLFKWGAKQAAKQRFAEKYKNDPDFRVYQVIKTREYKKRNPDKVSKWSRMPKHKIGLCVRNSLYRAVKRIKNGETKGSTQSIVGCSMSELKEWIECLFQPCMSWDNYGKVWSIDHIIPIRMAQGDLGVAKSLNHFTNLAPVPCQVNSTKSGSMEWDKHYRRNGNA